MVKNNSVPVDYFTTVSNGYIQLRSSQRSGVIQTFGNNIQNTLVKEIRLSQHQKLELLLSIQSEIITLH